MSPATTAWLEVADGVFQRRYDPLDISICLVRGSDGLLLVDTRSSHREADEIRADLSHFGLGRLRWVVNTHAHFDHSFGNARFGPRSDLDLPIYGHELVPAHLADYEVPKLADWVASGREPVEEWREVVITPPTVLVGDHTVLDLGDRAVELVHLGRGHTDNDLLLKVTDVDTWLVGDVLEESGPPMYGSGCFPLDWPATVTALLSRLGPDATVVPGHGAVVDWSFVASQRADITGVADLIQELYAESVPLREALSAGGGRWPFPVDGLGTAVERGYQALGSAR